MIKIIFKTIWNQRRQNGWIMIELILVGFFLWKSISPLTEIISTNLIDNGYDESGLYFAQLSMYNEKNSRYNVNMDNDTVNRATFMRAVNAIKQCPEVSSYGIADSWSSIPNSMNWTGNSIYPDTTDYNTQMYAFCNDVGGDLMETYRLKDALTGNIMHVNDKISPDQAVYISDQLAKNIFGSINIIGKIVHIGEDSTKVFKIAGVFKDVKTRGDDTPQPLTIISINLKDAGYTSALICFKIKDGVNSKKFEEKFKHYIAPRITTGNFYAFTLNNIKDIKQYYLECSGTKNTYRLQIMMSGFFLICVFLGMTGTFWIRCNNRRGDIGILKAMGSSSRHITIQFVTEALILVTIAFIISMIWIVNVIYSKDFFSVNPSYSKYPYLVFHPMKMFMTISVITYVIMIVTALIGTYIPVKRAAKTLPAEALRDE